MVEFRGATVYGGVVSDPSVFSDQPTISEPLSASRIRAAAMKCFATHGTEATSLRMVALTAGVSIGLVQHRFGSKAALIKAVDDELVTIVSEAAPLPVPPPDPIADVGHRVTSLIAEHPDAIDYLAHLLIEDHPTGRVIFDKLLDIGKAQWDSLRAQGHLRPDLDPTWSALNPLILVLGTLILRSHIERQLAQPFTTAAQLRKWETAINSLIDGGQLQKPYH
jgi:AcrR family transcriptional regulator